ncbi:MAG: hypothetical protein ACTHP8_02820 [Bosea sp. (in: a-proteobacteria)]
MATPNGNTVRAWVPRPSILSMWSRSDWNIGWGRNWFHLLE